MRRKGYGLHAFVTDHLRKHWPFIENGIQAEKDLVVFEMRIDSNSEEFQTFRKAVAGIKKSKCLSVEARIYVADSDGEVCSPCSLATHAYFWELMKTSPFFVEDPMGPDDSHTLGPLAPAFAFIDGLFQYGEARPCPLHERSRVGISEVSVEFDFRDLDMPVQYIRQPQSSSESLAISSNRMDDPLSLESPEKKRREF